MAVPITDVTFSSIQTAFGGSNPISMSEYYKGGTNVPANQVTQTGVSNPAAAAVATSGAIKVSTFRNLTKTTRSTVTYVIASNVDRKSIVIGTTAPTSGTYTAGLSDITITVNSGVYVYSTTTATPALTISGGTTGDVVTLVNNARIMGCGGRGAGWNGSAYVASGAGGVAISVGYNMSITNSGVIGGGGGGGGAAISSGTIAGFGGGGGGAGGGAGGTAINGSNTGTGGGGAAPGATGGNGTTAGNPSGAAGGGGGGRLFPGTGGAGATPTGTNGVGSGGSAGGGGAAVRYVGSGSAAGGGGGFGASGGTGVWNSGAVSGTLTFTSGAGGSTNGSGGNGTITSTGSTGTLNYYGGSAGGNAISKNGRTVIINSGGANIYGAQV